MDYARHQQSAHRPLNPTGSPIARFPAYSDHPALSDNGFDGGVVTGRFVRDDPERPDPGFAEAYASLPDAIDLEPWLQWCRMAAPPVLYLGAGTGRLAVPLSKAGIQLVAVDAHPGMLARLHARLPELPLVRSLIEDLALDRRFDLVIAPSNLLYTQARLLSAARHARRWVAFELLNPHWLLAGAETGVRLRGLEGDEAEMEIDYPGGWTQQAKTPLVWPEEVELLLDSAELDLQLMRGAREAADLASSPTYFVLACSRLRSLQTPSTY
jgi:hypothetical protein